MKLAWPLTWKENPYGERYWRFNFYALRPTVNLLWAYYATGDARYKDKLVAILKSYLAYDTAERCEYSIGRDFDDPHGAAFRAMILVNEYGKLKRSGDLSSSLSSALRAGLGRLGRFLADPDNFQGGYNHGLTEAAALLLMPSGFPDFEMPRASGAKSRSGDSSGMMNRTVER